MVIFTWNIRECALGSVRVGVCGIPPHENPFEAIIKILRLAKKTTTKRKVNNFLIFSRDL
jgi:hypothetical protein